MKIKTKRVENGNGQMKDNYGNITTNNIDNHQEIVDKGNNTEVEQAKNNKLSDLDSSSNKSSEVNKKSNGKDNETTEHTSQQTGADFDHVGNSSKISEHVSHEFEEDHTKVHQSNVLYNADKFRNDSASLRSSSSSLDHIEEFSEEIDEDSYPKDKKNTEQNETEHNLNEMTSAILEPYLEHCDTEQPKERFASCWLWDFAGQKDFYATHQAFLSSCAIYVLVADSLEFSNTEALWINFEESARRYL